jgi:hypothetical protein
MKIMLYWFSKELSCYIYRRPKKIRNTNLESPRNNVELLFFFEKDKIARFIKEILTYNQNKHKSTLITLYSYTLPKKENPREKIQYYPSIIESSTTQILN